MAALLLFAAAAVLAFAGAATAAIVTVAGGVVAAVPAGLSAAAKPRPGLVWQGRYAEPWRNERSPGEPPSLERAPNASATDT